MPGLIMHATDFAEEQSMSTSGISFCMHKGKILACKTKCCNFFKVHPLLWLHYEVFVCVCDQRALFCGLDLTDTVHHLFISNGDDMPCRCPMVALMKIQSRFIGMVDNHLITPDNWDKKVISQRLSYILGLVYWQRKTAHYSCKTTVKGLDFGG